MSLTFKNKIYSSDYFIELCNELKNEIMQISQDVFSSLHSEINLFENSLRSNPNKKNNRESRSNKVYKETEDNSFIINSGQEK